MSGASRSLAEDALKICSRRSARILEIYYHRASERILKYTLAIFRTSFPTRTAQSERVRARVGYSERSCKPVMQLKSVHPAKMPRRVNERARVSRASVAVRSRA